MMLLSVRYQKCEFGITTLIAPYSEVLHQRTSLQALMDYIKSDMDINVYWKTLNENGITKERLLSYDRAIHSEPNFRRDQRDGLLRDLGNYMRTLKVGCLNFCGQTFMFY